MSSRPGASMKRQQADISKLMMSRYEIEVNEAATAKGHTEFMLNNFNGPPGTAYEGGVYKIFVHLPADYPFKSPSIGFRTRIFHPNIDERSGSVCLDVINQAWSPMYELVNIFDVFLPQLLTYGNAADPLNGEAAGMMLREPERFNERVKEYVIKYARPSVSTTLSAAPTEGRPSPLLLAAPTPAGSRDDCGALAADEEDDDDVSIASGLSELSDL